MKLFCFLPAVAVCCLTMCPALELSAQESATLQEQDAFTVPATDDGLAGAGPIRRADWFQDVWRERRSRWASEIERDQRAVVFLGDSITQGWGDLLERHFPDVKLANRGISGDTTRGMLLRLEDDVLSLNPSVVVLLMGTNDLEVQASPETITGNVELILEVLKRNNGDMPIVLCLVFPSSASKNRPADQIRRLNNLLSEAVKGDPQVTVIDTWKLFANDHGDAKPDEFPDLLHPNEKGYTKWAAALRPILATHGFLETEADEFTLEPGFESLFNGHDLTGWQYRPTSPEDLESRRGWRAQDPNAPPWPIITETTSFDGQTTTPDGRFVASSGRLIVTTPSEGRKIQQLWTARELPSDFVLKLEFRATPNADSGVYIRGPQLQCRDYVLAGPYKDLANYKAQDWNEIVVRATGGVAHCTCNGEVIEEAMPVPETGPIGLEGDRGQVEYRRIRVQEF